MSKRNWTESQRWAISARNGSLLVSAAAGSGKTAVLVQRVIERLTDPERPCDADRLLIVTFTNAAAAEMKERISAAIGELLQADPANAQLQRQQILLNRAHISTIHSFCNELVRENFYKLDISPDFRISDSAEMTLLRQEAMDEVMEELYAKEDGSFQGLSDAFSFGRDVITDPKTPKSVRVIQMPQFLTDEIRDYLKSLYKVQPDQRIFEVTKSYLHHEMDRGAKEAGVKRIRIHDLRHPYVKPTTKNL